MSHEEILKLDPVIHAPNRLAILTILANVESANFTFLKEAIGITDGNLNTHLTKLEEHKFIKIKKAFVGKKPQTTCIISEKGRQAFLSYLDKMEQIVKNQKKVK